MRSATVEVTVRVPVLIADGDTSADAELLAMLVITEALGVDERLGEPEITARCVDLKRVEVDARYGLRERLMIERPQARQWGVAWVTALYDRSNAYPLAVDYGLTQDEADALGDALDYTRELADDDWSAVVAALKEVC